MLTLALKLTVLLALLAAPSALAHDYLPYTDYLPPTTLNTQEYQTGYNEYCRDADNKGMNTYQCVEKVIKEMTKRYDNLHSTCDHNGIFSLVYLLTTLEYQKASLEPGFFSDPEFVNHEDVVFAQYYFDAIDAYRQGVMSKVPPAWRIALDAAKDKSVSSSGDMLMGISAHINRDLPLVLATIGLTDPKTGLSRKPDHDRVNEFLARVSFGYQMNRFWDPSVAASESFHFGTPGIALMQEWREQAWRNAERLVEAQGTPLEKVVLHEIEEAAYTEGLALKTATSYIPLLGQNSSVRDAHCLANRKS